MKVSISTCSQIFLALANAPEQNIITLSQLEEIFADNTPEYKAAIKLLDAKVITIGKVNNLRKLLSGLNTHSKFVVEYFIKNQIARRSFNTLDPRYNAQMVGLEDAINSGLLHIKADPMNINKVYVRPTPKLTKYYYCSNSATPTPSNG